MEGVTQEGDRASDEGEGELDPTGEGEADRRNSDGPVGRLAVRLLILSPMLGRCCSCFSKWLSHGSVRPLRMVGQAFSNMICVVLRLAE